MADCGRVQLPDGRDVYVRDHALKQLRARSGRKRIRNPLRFLRCSISYARRLTLSPEQIAFHLARHGAVSEHWVDQRSGIHFIVVWDGRHQAHRLVTTYPDDQAKKAAKRKRSKFHKRRH